MGRVAEYSHRGWKTMQQRLLIFSRLISSEEKDTCLQLRRKIIRDLSPSSSKSNNPMLQRKKRMFGDVSKDSFIFSGSREVMEICFEQIC